MMHSETVVLSTAIFSLLKKPELAAQPNRLES